jgi:type II secretory pathway pseudopilin PulG
MIVVIAIISLLVGLVVPGTARLWSQRNEAGTINLFRGLLESARSRAKQSGEYGIFVYVDPEDDVQRVAFIEAAPPNKPDGFGRDFDAATCPPDEPGCVKQVTAVNRFRVISDQVFTVPRPYRVAPTNVIDPTINPPTLREWARECEVESNVNACARLGNDLFWTLDGDTPVAPRQRNHFTVIFDRQGKLIVGRDVLIHDPDLGPDGFGDKTRLRVTGVHTAEQYYRQDGTRAPLLDTSQPGSGFPLTHMVAYDDGVVANVPSAEGLVVYNDSVVEDLDGRSADATRGQQAGLILAGHLLRESRTVFINRQTGDITVGEKGQ